MTEVKFVVHNKVGLHARPASTLVKAAAGFRSKITIIKDDIVADAKSILTLLTLGARKGDQITIMADGEDEEEALKKILDTLENLED